MILLRENIELRKLFRYDFNKMIPFFFLTFLLDLVEIQPLLWPSLRSKTTHDTFKTDFT